MTQEIKIYEIAWPDGNREWVTGQSKTNAIATYLKHTFDPTITSIRDFDLTGVEMTALSSDALISYYVINDEGNNKMSFYDWLHEYKEGIVATTCYI